MQDDLRKLAALLRTQVKQAKTEKLAKCALAAQALLGLEHLRRKLGR